MRFGFVTCVQLGLACMEEIYKVGGHLDLVLTLPDSWSKKKSGRVYVDEFCERHGIDLVKSRNVNDDAAIQAVKDHEIDWLFIIGWSQIAHAPMLAAPRKGVLGMHPTLLPQGRGRAAIPWAIIKGLDETGVTLFQLDEGVDTGPIVAQERLPLSPAETATTLYQRVADAHQSLIHRVWWDLVEDRLAPVPQDDSQATYWEGRTPDDGRITSAMSIEEAERLVRATTHPYPGAFYEADGKIVRIWRGEIGDSASAPPQAYSLPLRDGIYHALDYEIEAAEGD
jgi:methionyl-tRNA formyltransferase